MEIFNVLFYEPIYNLIVVFYRLLGDNLALSIIAIGVIARVIFFPLTFRQIKMAESSREFSEKMKEVRKKYKNNKEKQQEELVKLQQEYLPAQLGGCLPMIFQFIVFINIYRVISNLINDGIISFNEVAYSFVPQFTEGYEFNSDLFGLIDLKETFAQNSSFPEFIPYLILILLVGATQYASIRILTALRNARKEEEEKKGKKSKKKAKKKKDKNEPDDFAEIFQQSTRQATSIMPILFMFISFNLPSGLSLYLITSSSLVILQQLILDRFRKAEENLDKN